MKSRRLGLYGLALLLAAGITIAGAHYPALANLFRVKLNGALVSGGEVIFLDEISPDSSRVVYRADQDTNDVYELYSVPLSGGSPVKLNGSLVSGGDVWVDFQISPNSSRVVYRADQETDNFYELYSVPLGGGTPVKLNGSLVSGGSIWLDFQISSDSSRVVYTGDQDTDTVSELYSVPLSGGSPVKLNGSLVSGGDVSGFEISPDSNWVVYGADQNTDGVYELFVVPLTGGTPVKLSGGGYPFQISPDNSRVVYRADLDTDNVYELYSVPLSGGSPIKLSGTMVSGGDISRFQISPDSSRVVYRADQQMDNVYELYSVPLNGGSPIKLNNSLVSGGDVQWDYQISPDSSRVVYLADQDIDNAHELYSVPLNGGTPIKLNDPLISFLRRVQNDFQISPDSSRVIYVGDLEENGVYELYSVPLNGGSPVKLNFFLDDGGTMADIEHDYAYDQDVPRFEISPDSSRVAYLVIQDAGYVVELYSVPIGGGSSTKLSGSLVNGGDVSRLRISPDSSRVVYKADQDSDEVHELYSVSIVDLEYSSEPGTGVYLRTKLPVPFSSNNAQGVAVGNLRGDGRPDLFAANASPNEIWENLGDGEFLGPINSLGDEQSLAVALGDVNNDGHLDAVIANSNGPNEVWLNDGSGSFTSNLNPDFTLGNSNSQAVAIGDLDGENGPDIIAVNGSGQPHEVWLNDGAGNFNSAPSFTLTLGAGNSQGVALGDLDGINGLDIVVVNDDDQTNEIWLNDGSGTFGVAAQPSQIFGGNDSQAVALGDIDSQDGLDIVVVNNGQPDQIWLNDGNGNFNSTSADVTLNNSPGQAIALGDLDGDLNLDAIIGNGSGQNDAIWLNDGSGNFNLGQLIPGNGSQAIALGDLDGDSDLDIFSGTADGVRVLLNENSTVREVPSTGGLLDFAQGLTFTLEIPNNVLDAETTFTFTPQGQPSESSPTLRFIDRSFTLDADQADPFNDKPVTATVFFDTNDPITPTLYYRDVTSGQWLDVTTTCTPNSNYIRSDNFVKVAFCHLTEFGLFGPNSPPTFNVSGSPLITPTGGIVLSNTRPIFDWADAEDDSGPINYRFTITGSGTFTGVGGQATTDVVTVTESTFTPVINLPAATYTWTVRVWDEAGLPGQVITPATFSIAAEESRSDVFLPVILK